MAIVLMSFQAYEYVKMLQNVARFLCECDNWASCSYPFTFLPVTVAHSMPMMHGHCNIVYH